MANAPSAPVQLIPPGLLGALQLKTGGRNPTSLGDAYVPTIDCLDWLLNAKQEFLIDVSSIATGPIFQGLPTLVVPDREWWYVHWLSAAIVLAATEDQINPQLWAEYNFPTALLPRVLLAQLPGSHSSAATSANVSLGAARFFLPPSTRLVYANLSGTLGANRNVTTHAVFSRLPI